MLWLLLILLWNDGWKDWVERLLWNDVWMMFWNDGFEMLFWNLGWMMFLNVGFRRLLWNLGWMLFWNDGFMRLLWKFCWMKFLNDGFEMLFWNDGKSVGGGAGLYDDGKMGKAYPNYMISIICGMNPVMPQLYPLQYGRCTSHQALPKSCEDQHLQSGGSPGLKNLTIKGPDNPTSQLLPKLSSGTGMEW